MHAATGVPVAESFPDPVPQANEVVARVLAAGLHPLVRAHAAGTHYTSSGTYPLVPGVDGVAALPDGRIAYIGWLRAPYGTFAELAVVDPTRVLPIPDGLAPEHAAAIVNPAMSGWLALKLRARIAKGDRVIVLGATGASGQLAVQIARSLGASRIVAVGRNEAVLGRLAADATVKLDQPSFADDLTRIVAGGVDIVLDYLWGEPARVMLDTLAAASVPATTRIRYVNIGEAAGARVDFSSHPLRSCNLEMLGSGFGSLSIADIAPEVPRILAAAARGEIAAVHQVVPLDEVSRVWATTSDSGLRVVLRP